MPPLAALQANPEGKMHKICSFYIADHLFGADILDIREIKDEFRITRICHAPPEVKGCVNIRGYIYLILDLRIMLGFPLKKTIHRDNRLILFKEHIGPSFGVLTDRVKDILEIPENRMENVRSGITEPKNIKPDERKFPGAQRRSELTKGIIKLEDALLIILDTEKLLQVF